MRIMVVEKAIICPRFGKLIKKSERNYYLMERKFETIKRWQNDILDEKETKKLQDSLLYSETKRFAVYLHQKGIQIDDYILVEYAKQRGFNE